MAEAADKADALNAAALFVFGGSPRLVAGAEAATSWTQPAGPLTPEPRKPLLELADLCKQPEVWRRENPSSSSLEVKPGRRLETASRASTAAKADEDEANVYWLDRG